ncbi:hypothetical protein BDV06DRAFT_231074 [Aspergillus oleicola]
MDPLSISASVAGLTASCVQTAKALQDLKDKSDNANLTISAIFSETTLYICYLVSNKLQNQPNLEPTLDQALTGCYTVFDQLLQPSGSLELGFGSKVRYMWSEGTMKDIWGQMRGVQSALTLLIYYWGDQNTAILSEVAQHASRITAIRAARVLRSGGSLYSSKLFAFDDEVVNSTAYCQVLAKAYPQKSSTTGFVPGNDKTELKGDLVSVSKQDIQRQSVLHELIDSEKTKNFGIHERFIHLHKELLYEPLIRRQWLDEASGSIENSALSSLTSAPKYQNEVAKNARFVNFLAQSRDHRCSYRLPCNAYMKSPIIRIQRYTLILSQVLKDSDPSHEMHHYHRLESLINDIRHLVAQCDVEVEKASKQPIAQRCIPLGSEIFFDEHDSTRPRSGLRAPTPMRVVVLVLPGTRTPRVLSLGKVSKIRTSRIGKESYDLVNKSREWEHMSVQYI